MPKATMSQDGQYRIDMRVTFRVSLGDLTTALAFSYRNHSISEDGPLPELSKAATQQEIREACFYAGTATDGWADDFSTAETMERQMWAEALVRKAFPELDLPPVTAATASATKVEQEPQHLSCHHHPSVRLDPAVKDIPACMPSAEFGIFADEGSLEVYDCAIQAANRALEFAAEDEDTDTEYTVRQVCKEHPDEAHGTCQECNADDSDGDDEEESTARCPECKGSGCHWCYWTGRKSV